MLLIAAFVVAAVFGWLLSPTFDEPEYRGTKLSTWVDRANAGSDEATVAIRKMGTNALPYLLTATAYEAPPAEKRKVDLVKRLPLGVFRRAAAKLTQADREHRAIVAWSGFRALGPAGAPAIPELTRLMSGTNRPVADRAMHALSFLGEDGLHALLVPLHDRQHPQHELAPFWVAQAYSSLGREGDAVPVLVACITEEESDHVLASAAMELGFIKHDPKLCVPVLTTLLQRTNYSVRMWAVSSLGEFGSDARSAADGIAGCLADSNWWVRLKATNALQRIAPEVLEGK